MRQYGTLYKDVMRDSSISVEAKAIYAYMCAYAGNGSECFPTLETMCHELGLSRNRFVKHREQLIEKGYIRISKKRGGKGFSRNSYYVLKPVSGSSNGSRSVALQNEAPTCFITLQNKATTINSTGSVLHPYNPMGLQNVALQNEATTINSLASNTSARPAQGRGGGYSTSDGNTTEWKPPIPMPDAYTPTDAERDAQERINSGYHSKGNGYFNANLYSRED